jgi:WD40 repeat protein
MFKNRNLLILVLKSFRVYEIKSLYIYAKNSLLLDIAILLNKKLIRKCTLQLGNTLVLCLTLLPNGNICSGSSDGNIRIWKGTECCKCIKTFKKEVESLYTLPNGDIVSASYNIIKMYSYKHDYQRINTLNESEYLHSYKFAFVPESGLLIASSKYWDDLMNGLIQNLK